MGRDAISPPPLRASGRAVDFNPPFLARLLDQKLLDILVCPISKGPLEYDRENQELVCKASGLAYPVRDGIPVMLEDEARKLTPEEVEALPA